LAYVAVKSSIFLSENIQEITTECCSCGKTPGKKAAIPAIREFKIPTSIRKNNQLSSVKKKERKVEFEKGMQCLAVMELWRIQNRMHVI
jgi:hypothetical protein